MLTLLLSLAAASPLTLAWQGRLLDVDGVTIHGEVALDLVLYNAATGGQVTHTESLTGVDANDGYVSVRLGEVPGNPLDSSDLLGGAWLGVSVGGATMGERQELVSVPYAGVAAELDGVARIGDTDDACSSGTLGTLRFRNDRFEGCTSTGWRSLLSVDEAGGVDISGPLTVAGSLTAQTGLDVSGATNITGALDVTGTADVGGVLSSDRDYWSSYYVSTSVSEALTPTLSGSWAALVSCAITGTTSSGSSVWLLKRSDAIYVERIASFGVSASNTPEIYASGLDFRIRLYNHPSQYGVRCHFTEII